MPRTLPLHVDWIQSAGPVMTHSLGVMLDPNLADGAAELGTGVLSWTHPAPHRWDLTYTAGEAEASTVLRAGVRVPDADPADFVFIPGVVYAGNRFRVGDDQYPPMVAAACPDDDQPQVTPIPRLAHPGPGGAIHLRAGNAATPLLAVWQPDRREATWVLTSHQSSAGEVGLHLEEDSEGRWLRVTAPSLRPVRYRMMDDQADSPDAGVALAPGEALRLVLEVHVIPCADLAEFYAAFSRLRHRIEPGTPALPQLPLSHLAHLVRRNLDERYWCEEDGTYYDVLTPDQRELQPGWVGSGMYTYALLGEGEPPQQARAASTLSHLTTEALAPGGLYYGAIGTRGRRDDGFDRPAAAGFHLLRKSGDMVLFLVRQCRLLSERGQLVPEDWTVALDRNLDALVTMGERDGTFGQFVDQDTGVIRVGGPTGAGTVLGALAEGGTLRHRPEAIALAARLGRTIADRVIGDGYSVGGPGEILKAPDSESCFGLLEGLVSLWEVTGDPTWLTAAQVVALHGMSWTVSYDYAFPATSTFGRMAMQSTGTVIANSQNQHSAPGICSLSSLALLKVARATGRDDLKQLAVDIARALPQFVSREDRPIVTCEGRVTPPGFLNERVNLSDWELGGIGHGEVFYGNCWPTTSALLTAYEFPGVWVDGPERRVWTADHVEADLLPDGQLRLTNPTAFPAEVKVVVDPDPTVPWREAWEQRQVVRVDPGQTATVEIG